MKTHLRWLKKKKKRSYLMNLLQPLCLQTCTQVPRVFIGGKCVGGGSDVSELHERGELKNMLVSIGALQ